MKNFSVYIITVVTLLNCAAGVVVSENKSEKTGNRMLILKNPLLTVAIDCDRGGMLHSFIPVNSGHDEVYISSDNKGGACEHLLAGSNQNREISFSPYKTDILMNTPEKAIIRCSYRLKSGELKDVEFQKFYTMTGDSASLAVEWKIINHTERRIGISPWIRNIVTGYDQDNITAGKAPLDSDSSVMLECGAFRKVASAADGFFEPARNWFARVPKKVEKGKNIVNFIFDYNEVFQFYTVHFKHMHTMELLFRFIDLAPQESWTGRFAIVSGASLSDVRFASTDIAADLVRREGKLFLSLTAPRNIKDAQVLLLDNAGKTVGTATVSVPALEVAEVSFPDAAGDIFELKVISNGKDLMLDRHYAGKFAEMKSTLKSFHAPRRPEKFEKVLEPWKKELPGFENPAPRKLDVQLVDCSVKNLQVWANSNIERIMEKDHPLSDIPAENPVYTICGAKAERESFQIALRNSGKKELKNISVSLKCEALKDIEMTWNVLEYITTTRPSLGMSVIGRWPEVLDTARSFAIAPEQTRSVWAELKIPRTAAAGVYDASAEISQDNKVVAVIPLKIRIFDFELPKVPSLRTDTGRFYGNYLKMAQRYGFKGTQKELLEQLNLSILEHRMSPRGLVASRYDLRAYEADLIRHIKAGANVFSFPGTKNCNLKTRKAIEAIHEKHGISHLSYTYAFDEIHSEQIPVVNKWCEKWKEEHKIPILVVYYGGPVKPLYGSIDIWCRALLKEDAELLADRNGKDEIWYTNTPLYSVERAPVEERAVIWKIFSLGMKGRLLWSVASWTNSPYIQTFRSGQNLHGVLYYPAPEGIRPGIRLKVIADAVDDFDYLCILKSEAARVKSSGKAAELVAEAEKLLDDKFYLNKELAGDEYLQKRNQAGILIEKLSRIK